MPRLTTRSSRSRLKTSVAFSNAKVTPIAHSWITRPSREKSKK
jgi:hypothetical protein